MQKKKKKCWPWSVEFIYSDTFLSSLYIRTMYRETKGKNDWSDVVFPISSFLSEFSILNSALEFRRWRTLRQVASPHWSIAKSIVPHSIDESSGSPFDGWWSWNMAPLTPLRRAVSTIRNLWHLCPSSLDDGQLLRASSSASDLTSLLPLPFSRVFCSLASRASVARTRGNIRNVLGGTRWIICTLFPPYTELRSALSSRKIIWNFTITSNERKKKKKKTEWDSRESGKRTRNFVSSIWFDLI